MTARRDTVGIVGAGPFGSALASVLARAGRRVILWSRDAAIVEQIRATRRSPRLPAAELPEPLEATTDPRRLASEARFVILAVTSTNVRDRARALGDVLDGSHIVVHAVGAFAAPDHDRVSQVMEQGLPTLKIGAIAGPALPDDLGENKYSSIVVASVFDEVVAEGRRLLNTPPALRVYGTKDLVGVELASALSGAYTIALGMSDGLSVGPGTRAVLITRALAEASRLGVAAGAEARTFAGLAGLGNLLVRASDHSALPSGSAAGRGQAPSSDHSALPSGSAAGRGQAPSVGRSADYQLGLRLAAGEVTPETGRTEGARAAIAGLEIAKGLRVRMPVLQGLAAVLAGKLQPRDVANLIGDSVADTE